MATATQDSISRSTGDSNRLAMIAVDRNLLVDMVGLPHDTSIVQAFIDLASMTVFFVVQSPDLPEVKEGARPPLVNPTITTTFDWGIKNEPAQ